MLALIGVGLLRTLLGDAAARSRGVDAGRRSRPRRSALLLLMRAFADGCSAITGVEAISNGVPAFKPPEWKNARTDAASRWASLVGVDVPRRCRYLAGDHRRRAERLGESVISQIGRAVFGSGPLYYVLQLSTMGILVLAANTSFADFPRLASILARDGFMPRRFAFRGERLAFSAGIVVARDRSRSSCSVAFGGRVEALIPLYAIGVFTSFTLSQAGMVRHWLASGQRRGRRGWRRGAVINGVGAVSTGIVAVIFAIAKFALGAWLIIIVIPLLVAGMLFIGRQYQRRRLETQVRPEAIIGPPRRRQRVIVPVPDVTRDVVTGDQVRPDDVRRRDGRPRHRRRRRRGRRSASGSRASCRACRSSSSSRRIASSSGRSSATSRITAARDGDDVLVVLLPEYVPRHWWERFLYNENAPPDPRGPAGPREHPRRRRPVPAGRRGGRRRVVRRRAQSEHCRGP